MSNVPLFEKEGSVEVFSEMASYDHEMIVHCHDRATGLKAIIAVHNTTLGPAMGGLRMWPYATEGEALTDALRLSRGMTLKNALAGINVGGGKAVIIGNARTDKTEAMLRRFGKFVHNLGGKYYTAEDVGMSEDDMEIIRTETPYVTGISQIRGGSGDPSPVTAYGTYLGMKAAMKKATGSDSLNGKRVLVQGVGHVGGYLVDHLVEEGAKVFIYDIYPQTLEAVSARTGATIISEEEVYTLPVDVYAPCALGGTLNPETIPQLNCMIVCGAANNQLLDEVRDAQDLKDRGILYAPDFMVNAGGIINVSLELEVYHRDLAMRKTERIYETAMKVFDLAGQADITTHEAALKLAEQRIAEIGHNLLYR
ncbi:Glu/Leu/Phe/Val dehydrogenase dimerization domain-containing protein [Pontibacter sp. G13]|uniref:Glu/Leu/Phe/Val dehydrogenase dimerization domain-containing protein n=1 Tax=Pontibacter sp. G13 TaxID=3074898 RepID=UPI00288BC8EA|nr:Glu/Leu/Phe/Val dehydrogenase dimerization domain-containing protein [Pontibacter sp. G13]WNJ18039.1 Glu/Leu/Phe/Val dehydrogenase dimerization domain-containing protein [Pontibacter sp. G13]